VYAEQKQISIAWRAPGSMLIDGTIGRKKVGAGGGHLGHGIWQDWILWATWRETSGFDAGS
jgi:hypothetical protein